MEDIDNILAQYGLQGIAANDEAVEVRQQHIEPENLEPVDLEPVNLTTEENTSAAVSTTNFSDELLDEVLSEHGFIPTSADTDFIEDTNVFVANSESESSEDDEVAPSEYEEVISSGDEESVHSEGPTPTISEDALLPTNSPTLLIDDATSRFSGAEWYNEIQNSRIIIGGMGGISSHLAFNIARMAPASITMYDDDIVETANMSGQLYSRNDIGLPKVDAMVNMLQAYTTTSTIYAIKEKFMYASEAGNIMLCGFDNMMARKIFFQAWKRHVEKLTVERRANCLFMDGRLSLSVMQIFCIAGDDEYNMKKYQDKYLFGDSEADETVCSMKQTTYLASMIGATMTNLFTNFIANTLDPLIPYTLPFLTEYDAQYMIFKTEN